jgi:hypothetical protein
VWAGQIGVELGTLEISGELFENVIMTVRDGNRHSSILRGRMGRSGPSSALTGREEWQDCVVDWGDSKEIQGIGGGEVARKGGVSTARRGGSNKRPEMAG